MNYFVNLSSRLNHSMEEYSIGRLKRISENDFSHNEEELIEHKLNEILTNHDKFYIYACKDKDFELHFSEKTIEDLTRSYSGKVKHIAIKHLREIENEINAKIQSVSERPFADCDTFFRYLSRHKRQIAEEMGENCRFTFALEDKMSALIERQQEKEQAQESDPDFMTRLRKMLHMTSTSQWVKSVELAIKENIYGALSVEEVQALFQNPKGLKDYQIIRVNLAFNKACHDVFKVEKLGVYTRKKSEVPKEEMLAVKGMISAMWKGTVLSLKKSDVNAYRKLSCMFDILFSRYHYDPSVVEDVLKDLFANATDKEIDLLRDFFRNAKSESRFFGEKEEYAKLSYRENIILRSLPARHYLSNLKGVDLSSIDEFQHKLAVLLYVRSLHEEDFQGIMAATKVIEGFEGVEMWEAHSRYLQARAWNLALVNNSELHKSKTLQAYREVFTKQIFLVNLQDVFNDLTSLLSPEELAVFSDNYTSKYPLDSEILDEEISKGVQKIYLLEDELSNMMTDVEKTLFKA